MLSLGVPAAVGACPPALPGVAGEVDATVLLGAAAAPVCGHCEWMAAQIGRKVLEDGGGEPDSPALDALRLQPEVPPLELAVLAHGRHAPA